MSNNSDILFQDADVCILKPTSKRGILVIHRSTADICSDGLYSYNELIKSKPELGLKPKEHMFPGHSDIIYFRAPYNNDLTNFESLYPNFYFDDNDYYVLIKIDPEYTYVYNQEGRVYSTHDTYLSSRINLLEYFKIIEKNKNITPQYPLVIYGNTISFNKMLTKSNKKNVGTYKQYLPTERMGEILVKTPHIPKEWFYYCGKGKITNAKLEDRIFGFPPNLQIINGGFKKRSMKYKYIPKNKTKKNKKNNKNNNRLLKNIKK